MLLKEEGDSSWNINFYLTFILPIPPAMYLSTDEYPLFKWKLGGFTSSIYLNIKLNENMYNESKKIA